MRTAMDRILYWIITGLLVMMLVCVVWQVLSRYIVASPSTVTEELSRFGLIWLGLLGTAYVAGQKRHLAIDLISSRLSGVKAAALALFVQCAILAFALLAMVYGGMRLVLGIYRSGQVSPILGINMGYIYLAIPVCGLLVAVYTVLGLLAPTTRNEETR